MEIAKTMSRNGGSKEGHALMRFVSEVVGDSFGQEKAIVGLRKKTVTGMRKDEMR